MENLLIGQTITSIEATEDGVILYFGLANMQMQLEDIGQNCCEHRYASTDDDLEYFKGSQYQGHRVLDGPEEEGCGEYHDTQFLHVDTSKGTFTIVNHNEHNGYYGGFCVRPFITEYVS